MLVGHDQLDSFIVKTRQLKRLIFAIVRDVVDELSYCYSDDLTEFAPQGTQAQASLGVRVLLDHLLAN